MAEPAGNNERMELRLGSKSLGLTTRDLIPVLLLIMIGVLGYFRTKILDGGMQTLGANQAAMRGEMHHQNSLLQTQTEVSRQELRQQNVLLHQYTEYTRALLETLNYNLGRPPGEHLPLGRAPPRPPGGER